MENSPMQFMQMAPMQKNGQQDQMMKLLQATLARGAQTPGAAPQPQQGQVAPGGGPMNLVPPQAGVAPGGFLNMMAPGKPMGMLGNILNSMQQPGAAAAVDPAMALTSGNALY